MIQEYNKAIVRVPELVAWKIANGLVLPEGYRLAKNAPFVDHISQSVGFVVESPDIPHSKPGHELPVLWIEDGYSHIVVKRYGDHD